MNYNPKVYELVEHFLKSMPEKNTERNRHLLAQHIQDELETGPSLCCCRSESRKRDVRSEDKAMMTSDGPPRGMPRYRFYCPQCQRHGVQAWQTIRFQNSQLIPKRSLVLIAM